MDGTELSATGWDGELELQRHAAGDWWYRVVYLVCFCGESTGGAAVIFDGRPVWYADDGWHVDYELKTPLLNGGGPHYIIDPVSGQITWKKYEQ